jgi:hypothetical protein
MLLGVYRGVAHDKMAFACCRIEHYSDCRSLHRRGNLEGSLGDGWNREPKLQSMGRLQLRAAEDFAKDA